MTIPATWKTVTVTRRWLDKTGAPREGLVTFTDVVYVRAAGDTYVPTIFRARLDETGAIAVQLPATDDPDISPRGWTYLVREQISGLPARQYMIRVPHDAEAINLADVEPAVPVDPTSTYIDEMDIGVRVASLVGGKVPLDELPPLDADVSNADINDAIAADPAASRAALQLGSAATADVADFDAFGAAAAAIAALPKVARSGSYSDLDDKPVIPAVPEDIGALARDGRDVMTGALATDVADAEVVRSISNASGNVWWEAIGNGNQFARGQYRFGFGVYDATRWLFGDDSSGGFVARVAIASPKYMTNVDGRGVGAILEWQGYGVNFSGRAIVGHDYGYAPNDDPADTELVFGPGSTSEFRVRDPFGDEKGGMDMSGRWRAGNILPPEPVAGLRAPASVIYGAHCVALDGRKAGEGPGAGTGCPVWCDGERWLTYYDNTEVQA